MIKEIRNIDSSPRELKKFALIMAAALAVIGCLLLWREKGLYLYSFILAVAFLLSGLLAPKVLKPLQKAWMTVSIAIGWVMTRLVLILLFYLVLTPTALLMHLFRIRKDLLDLKFDKSELRDSYWTLREKKSFKPEDYLRQF